MQKISGIVILTGTCWAFSSARWRRFTRISDDWTRSTLAIGMPKASAWTIELTNERSSGEVGAFGERAQRLGARRPDLHLAEHPRELVGQRTLGVVRDLLQGGVEAETGLHRDGEEVDGVGELALHPVRAVVGALVEVHRRGEEAGQR